MALILHLETASPVCSVALSRDGVLLGLRESSGEKSHATRLTLFIEELLSTNDLMVSSLDAISLGMGPGSYTGLRIGTSVGKGLAYGAGKPLIGIPTLQALAAGFLADHPETEGFLCPMLDARRMEVYTAIYNPDLHEISPVEAMILTEESLHDVLEVQPVWFFGSGSLKAAEMIHHPNARFGGAFPLSAAFQTQLAVAAWAKKDFLDTAYFEPHYLKEFIATVAKNKLW